MVEEQQESEAMVPSDVQNFAATTGIPDFNENL